MLGGDGGAGGGLGGVGGGDTGDGGGLGDRFVACEGHGASPNCTHGKKFGM